MNFKNNYKNMKLYQLIYHLKRTLSIIVFYIKINYLSQHMDTISYPSLFVKSNGSYSILVTISQNGDGFHVSGVPHTDEGILSCLSSGNHHLIGMESQAVDSNKKVHTSDLVSNILLYSIFCIKYNISFVGK